MRWWSVRRWIVVSVLAAGFLALLAILAAQDAGMVHVRLPGRRRREIYAGYWLTSSPTSGTPTRTRSAALVRHG